MGKRDQQQQNKRSYEQVEQGDDPVIKVGEPMDTESTNDTNNNAGNNKTQKKNMKKQEQANVKPEDEEFEDADDEEQDDEEDVIEEEEEIEEEVEEEEDEDEDDAQDSKTGAKSSNQSGNQASSGGSQQNSGNADKRPRLTDELYEMNLRRKKEHVGSALYIPFPRKVTEEEVRAFVGQGPNIFLVGPQKQNAIVRYRTQAECEKQQKELAKKEFGPENATLNIEPKTVKIDPANIDVKTLIVQYSNPDLSIVDFAEIFVKAISISLKGGKTKKESQEDLSFGSAIIIFPSHDEAKEAFLATENLNIKGEQLRVVFADFRPSGPGNRTGGFRNKGGDNNRGNFNRGNRDGRPGGGNFRNRNNRQGGNRNYGNRNFNQSSGGGGGGGGGGGSSGGSNYNQSGRNYSPNKKFRSNVR